MQRYRVAAEVRGEECGLIGAGGALGTDVRAAVVVPLAGFAGEPLGLALQVGISPPM
ncbi:hypothetical protein ACIP5Y_07870 [Nocardia sp. NPDC088792]|uniref:hypothetical protein n=1 Tax=Nocardia sp. NPDC088792 TaxID=3364332 RepID=UPI00380CE749